MADAILDALLREDTHSRCACEVTAAPGELYIMGEITTTAQVDYEAVARDTVREIGYDKGEYGFNADTMTVRISLHQQSPDIAMGVDRADTSKSRAAGLATRCEIQLSYAIGLAEPISLMVDTSGTGSIAAEELAEILLAEIDLTPSGIIQTLALNRPEYRRTAAYGHFGQFSKEMLVGVGEYCIDALPPSLHR